MRKIVVLPTLQIFTPVSSRGFLPYVTVAAIPTVEDKTPLLIYKGDYQRYFDFEMARHFEILKLQVVPADETLATAERFTTSPVTDELSGDWKNESKGLFDLTDLFILMYRTDVTKITDIQFLPQRPPNAKYPIVQISLNLSMVTSLQLR